MTTLAITASMHILNACDGVYRRRRIAETRRAVRELTMNQTTTAPRGVIEMDFAPGNLGNKMLQYLAALSLRERLPGFELSNVRIGEWQIDLPPIPQQTWHHRLRYTSNRSAVLDVDAVAAHVARRGTDRVELNFYSSQVGNLPPVEAARAHFPLLTQAEGYGADVLLINVRAGEILQAVHPEYTVLPVSFYRQLVAESGLRPVFLGQLDDSRYVRSLREAFPGAEFVASRGAVHDFSVIAKSRHIVMAVSTFSWLAGWLSRAERVVMPLSGFMNPLQYANVDLMPAGDPRFTYYLFPENRAVVDADIEIAHRALEGRWRQVGHAEVHANRPRPAPIQPQTFADKLRWRVRDALRRVR